MSSLTTDEANLRRWREDFNADRAANVARNAVTTTDVDSVALDRAVVTSLDHSVSHKVDDWKVTDQKRSGRCWIFSGLNSLRSAVINEEKIKDFEFSQAFAHFYDKLEKANYFLNAMAELADRDIEDRTVQHLLAEPVEDGGQWSMFVALIDKYGAVPKYAMPETHSSSHTAHLNRDLNALLRRGALKVREDAANAEKTIAEVLADAYRVLTIHLGVPPERFVWQYRDKDGDFHREGTYTPREFAKRYIPEDLGEYVCLVNDPRNEYGRRYTVDYLGNVVGAGPVVYLNAPADALKRAAAATLVDGRPVWFGADSTPHASRELGFWADGLYDYESLYGVELGMSKTDRLITGESMMVHAMVFTGVDLADADVTDSAALPENPEINRWRVENSWGGDKADKGFWTMADNFFEPFVYEIAVHPRYLSEELRRGLETEPVALPAWDPMGALAR